jgi:hypothetical protein
MKLAIQIVSWIMLAVGLIAVIELIVQANQGVTGNGDGIVIGIIWIIQSVLALVYAYHSGVTKPLRWFEED